MTGVYLPNAPRDLNRSVCKEMLANGAPNYIFAKYFHDIAINAMDSDFEIFKLTPELSNSRASKLAARFVFDFLKRVNLPLTRECVEKEAQNALLSDKNKISMACLEITKVRPPIQKLIRQRYVELNADHDLQSEGWFNIDSEVLETRSESDSDPTFEIPRGIQHDEDDNRSYRKMRPKHRKVHNEYSETISVTQDNSQQIVVEFGDKKLVESTKARKGRNGSETGSDIFSSEHSHRSNSSRSTSNAVAPKKSHHKREGSGVNSESITVSSHSSQRAKSRTSSKARPN